MKSAWLATFGISEGPRNIVVSGTEETRVLKVFEALFKVWSAKGPFLRKVVGAP